MAWKPGPIERWLLLTWQLFRPYGRFVYYILFPARRPRYFRAAWTYPGDGTARDAASRAAVSAPRLPAFIFFPMNDWHARIQRSQHLARALAGSGHLCIYVNPHLGLEYTLPYAFSASPRVYALSPNLLELHVHLPREHELNQRPLLPAEVRRIVSATTELLAVIGMPPTVLIVSLPLWLDVLEQLRAKYGFPILYDCHDLLAGFAGIPSAVIDSEDRLLRACDRVAFSSVSLMQTMLQRNPALKPKAALLRNGVTPADFQAPDFDRANATRCAVGYMGALDSWFDCDAVQEAARCHPSVDFELLGAVRDRRIWQLRDLPNVRLLGEVAYAELGRHMAKWSVATIPFLRNPLTLSTNPIKIYEYFSAGLPVVATRLPELEQFADLIYLTDTPEQFAAGIGHALTETGDALSARRKFIANQETWTERANSLRCLVQGIHAD